MHATRTARVLILSGATAITQVIALATLAVLTRVLTIQDLATYRQMLLLLQILTPLLTLGLPQALYYFLPRQPASERTVVSSTLLPLAVLAILPILLFASDARHHIAHWFNNPALATPLLYLTFYPILAVPAFLLEPILVTKHWMTAFTLYTLVTRTALAIAVIAAAVLYKEPHYLAVAHVLVAAVSFALALYLIGSACKTGSLTPNLNLSKAALDYSLPLGLASLLGSLSSSIGALVVSFYCPPEHFALYSLGSIELPLIAIIVGAISTTLRADFIKLIHNNELTEALALFHRSTRYSASLLLPLMVFLLLAAPLIYELLFTPGYADAALPFRILLCALPIRIVHWNPLLGAFGLTRQVLISTIVGIVCYTTLSLCFVQLIGYAGPALAFVLSLYLWTLPYNLYHLAKSFKKPWHTLLPLTSLAKISAVMFVAAIVPTLLLITLQLSALLMLTVVTVAYWPIVFLGLKGADEMPLPQLWAALRRMRSALTFART